VSCADNAALHNAGRSQPGWFRFGRWIFKKTRPKAGNDISIAYHEEKMATGFEADIAAVSRIPVVPTILEVVSATTGMGFAAVARVTKDRWVACGVRDGIAFGLEPGGELRVETTICHEIRGSGEAVVINNVADDEIYGGHPTPAMYGFQSYISVPIVLADGSFFGTLCAIDPRPARIDTPEIIGMFKLFAELIAFHLDANRQLAASHASLLNEREAAEFREQFIAVLGHDLRNPLAAISAAAEIVRKTPLNDKATRMVGLIQKSVARMAGLIDDVMDFARGRLGSGVTLQQANDKLEPGLRQVVAELQASFPDRVIALEIAFDDPIVCDHARIAQLLSNLLGNALMYGAAEKPIQVRASADAATFALSVANAGEPIPPEALKRMFQPFARGAVRPSQQGLGLGLFIASEVARAHGGTLDVVSLPQETRFTFRMPLVRGLGEMDAGD
jgi:signal transduction histidine kinase